MACPRPTVAGCGHLHGPAGMMGGCGVAGGVWQRVEPVVV